MLDLRESDGYLAFNEDECRSAGRSLSATYRSAHPFPNIVIDDFLSRTVLKRVLDSFPSNEGKTFFDRDQERLKYQFRPHEAGSGLVRNLFAEFNGYAFLTFLEELTGIKGLIGDPWFEGGGLHEIKRGGHLGVHADFNVHSRLKAQRRINLLVYLNEDWLDDYGGQLELWDKSMARCAVRVKPLFGRAVIFNTELDSFHGHPDALTCPPDRTRRSIATYYYSAPEEGVARLPKRTTNFRVRPGSKDPIDWTVRRFHFINDWVPPRLQKVARRLLKSF